MADMTTKLPAGGEPTPIIEPPGLGERRGDFQTATTKNWTRELAYHLDALGNGAIVSSTGGNAHSLTHLDVVQIDGTPGLTDDLGQFVDEEERAIEKQQTALRVQLRKRRHD